ncbi:MAG: CRISPR-associated protein Cas4 [Halobacteriota archaeon]
MRFNVSWVGKCIRWSYLKCVYPDSEKFDKSKLEVGMWAERVAQQKLAPYHVKKGRNRKLHFQGFTLSGRADFVAKNWVVEVKKSNIGYKRPEWFAQLNLYLLMENKDIGILFEVGDERNRVTKIKFSPRLVKESIEYFCLLRNHIMKEEIPQVPRNRYCWFCSYRGLCMKLGR